ncbi:Glucanosyltransferase-domain-containing protein [Pseudomassariella vexata]|uniref:1,3-beta-glucanosyltransferase n=1 Tax=Pseudomassariella vexata TaxID=1141098 RepID=A0A1Y2DI49_9PEZI|nr:Glucanosyltransferase-domain-containing protein [Pseudomassariella vexata]ORY58921.1 Glucanosyltransferase-domain-containing protein [Pseudomassariella vexata]
MKTSPLLFYLSLGAVAISGVSAADESWSTIPDIEVYGQHFFYTNNGSQFFLKGVGYQQDYDATATSSSSNTNYVDPLADADSCKRDIPYMKEIFTNVIRVYAVDPTQDHDDCMAQLASADIYVMADLSAPNVSINSNDPEWNMELYERYTAVIDAFAKYNNVIGFFAGNEVVSADNQTAAAAFVKAAVRDSKSYIQGMNYRSSLGVGYATADVATRDDLAYYFACEPTGDNSTSIDFWGYNVYSWCGNSSYTESGYSSRYDFFKDYPVPVFFAEYGCIEGIDGGATNRPFDEVEVLYGQMSDVFSGGIVYEYFMEDNEYGLVTIKDNSVSAYPDYTSLSKKLATVSPTITQSSAYTPSNTVPACPTVGVSSGTTWAAKPSPLPPFVNPSLCTCLMAEVDCTITSDDADDYGSIFSYICAADESYCAGIARNATLGNYGAYSGCSAKQQLAFVANQYYQDSGSNSASACDFSGLATTQAGTTASTCSSLLSAAGTAGTGSVVSPTGQQGTAAGSSSSSGGAMGGFAGLGGNGPSFFDFGKVLFFAYAIAGIVSAVSIFVL